MRTLLVTGGSGYLGSHVARAALAQGWQVYATYHSRPFGLANLTALPLDLRDADKTRAVLRNIHPHAVIHTACSNRGEQPHAIVPAALSLASAARELGCRLVHVSTDMVFDGEHAPYTDTSAPAPLTGYGKAKAEAEALVAELYPPAISVRPSLIWGLKPLDQQTGWLVESLNRGEPVTLFTDEYRCPIYVHDLAAALLELAHHADLNGIMNIGGSQALTRWDFGMRLLKALNRMNDQAALTPGTVKESGLVRPRDLTMISARAARVLKTRLRGVDEVMAELAV